ncbi:class I SAM-dependent methyltransferase [Tamlana sp. PT2-4]|uniref:Class I SAM-dependent methyltransferase n=2 Tax=Neotamlana laminarinivorans TaxID=2883124 RepID=A0A9X1I1H3_9FLAO|nr:class I SAM-dependent methyltransferase [Tamlana laminarinivorans]
MMSSILSPLLNNAKVKVDRVICVENLIKDYKKHLNIDVSSYFIGLQEITLYKCELSGYRFFYPYNVAGNGFFYEQLQSYDWYYMPWKWENQKTLSLLNKTYKILEIGSGGLGFIKKLNDLGYNITGLELNENSVKIGQSIGVNIKNESIQNHAKTNLGYYDFVCSFQVLEHISEVNSFIEAQISCLKKGGKLLISVPNNNSFIKFNHGGILNAPPHHMGLWDINSLKYLTNIYNIKLDSVFYEPLQDYHLDWFINSSIAFRFKRMPLLRRFFGSYKFKILFRRIVKVFQKFIKGHTIIAVFVKEK